MTDDRKGPIKDTGKRKTAKVRRIRDYTAFKSTRPERVEETKDKRKRESLTQELRPLLIQAIKNTPVLSEKTRMRIDEIKTKTVEGSYSIDEYIRLCEQDREMKLIGVASRHRAPSISVKKDRDEITLENLTEFAEHIIRFGYSVADLIIRFCDSPLISTKDTHNVRHKYLLLPMFDYLDLLHLLSISKYREELFKIFSLPSVAI